MPEDNQSGEPMPSEAPAELHVAPEDQPLTSTEGIIAGGGEGEPAQGPVDEILDSNVAVPPGNSDALGVAALGTDSCSSNEPSFLGRSSPPVGAHVRYGTSSTTYAAAIVTAVAEDGTLGLTVFLPGEMGYRIGVKEARFEDDTCEKWF